MTKKILKYRLIILALVIFLSFFGLISIKKINYRLEPNYKLRTAIIEVISEKMPAYLIDDILSKPLEEELMSIQEIKNIKSISQSGKLTVFIDLYEKFSNLEPIWDKIKRRIDRVELNEIKNCSVFFDDEFDTEYQFLISIDGNDYLYKVLKEVINETKIKLLRSENVSKVKLFGEQNQAIYLTYKKGSIHKYKFNYSYLKNILNKRNIIAQNGEIFSNGNTLKVYMNENYKTINDVIKTKLLENNNEIINIGDIFDVYEGIQDPITSLTKFNNRNCIVLAISMKEKSNIFELSSELEKIISDFRQEYPYGININMAYSSAKELKMQLNQYYIGIFLSTLVLFFVYTHIFNLKIALINFGFILNVYLSTFSMLYFLKYEPDIFSLYGIIFSSSVFVFILTIIFMNFLEVIKKHKNISSNIAKLYFFKLSERCQITFFYVYFSILILFVPFLLTNSIIREYLLGFILLTFVTLLTFIIYFSTILQIYMSYFFDIEQINGKYKKYKNIFLKLFKKIENKKIYTYILIIIPLISIILLIFCEKNIFPERNSPNFEIKIRAIESAEIKETEKIINRLQKYISSLKGIENTISFIGIETPRYIKNINIKENSINKGTIIVNLANTNEIKKTINNINSYSQKNIYNANIKLKRIKAGTLDTAKYEIKILENETKNLEKLINSIKDNLPINEKRDILFYPDYTRKFPDIEVKIDKNSMARNNLSPYQMSNSIVTSTLGNEISKYYKNNEKTSIYLKLKETEKQKLDNLDTIEIYSEEQNKTVPLSEIAKLHLGFNYVKVIRENGLYESSVISDKDDLKFIENYLKKNKEKQSYEFKKYNELEILKQEFTKYLFWELISIIILSILTFRLFKAKILHTFVPILFILCPLSSIIGIIINEMNLNYLMLIGITFLEIIIVINIFFSIQIFKKNNSINKHNLKIVITCNFLLGIIQIPFLLIKNQIFYSMFGIYIFGLVYFQILILCLSTINNKFLKKIK